MELLASWNNLSTQINNKNNLFVQNNFLKNTEISKLKNSIIIQGREIDTNNFLFLLENNNTFLILQINISSEYPIEKSRIHKYTELDLLLELEILQNKLKKIYYKIMEKVIQKIFYLNIFSSKPYLYKLNSQFCHTFYIKPNEVSIPLMNKLLFNENESNINIVEKTFNLV
jgi:hypothetical protein